jgi:hypothetical protein
LHVDLRTDGLLQCGKALTFIDPRRGELDHRLAAPLAMTQFCPAAPTTPKLLSGKFFGRVLNDDDDRDFVVPPVSGADLIDATEFRPAAKLEFDGVVEAEPRAEGQRLDFQLSDRFWVRLLGSLQKNLCV